MKSSLLLFVAICVFVLGSPLNATAQDPFGEYESVGASYHKFVLPGEASITVLVLGTTGASGLYKVGRGTDLGTLLAITGASLGVPSATVTVKTTFTLYRSGGGGSQREKVYESSLEDFLGTPGDYPPLSDGDVFVIETESKTRFTWREGLSIITAAAALTLTAERLGLLR